MSLNDANDIAKDLEMHFMTEAQRRRYGWIRPLAIACLLLAGGAFGSGFVMATYLGKLPKAEALERIQDEQKSMRLELVALRTSYEGLRQYVELVRQQQASPLAPAVVTVGNGKGRQ